MLYIVTNYVVKVVSVFVLETMRVDAKQLPTLRANR